MEIEVKHEPAARSQSPKRPPTPLDLHNQQVVQQQLDRQIAGSQESLYFVLRSLGLPAVGKPGSVPRVEVDAQQQPTLWAALERLGLPHDGKTMVVEAEGPSVNSLGRGAGRGGRAPLGGAMRRVRSAPCAAPVPPLALGCAAATGTSTPSGPPSRSAAEQRLRCEQMARPRRSKQQDAASGYGGSCAGSCLGGHGGYGGYGGPSLQRAASQPRLSASETEELISRLNVTRHPPRRPPGAPSLRQEMQEEQKWVFPRSAEQCPPKVDPEAQRQFVEELARPKIKPPRFRPRQPRPKSAVDAAEQRFHMARLSRPKSANGSVAFGGSVAWRLDGAPCQQESDNSAWAFQAEQLLQARADEGSGDDDTGRWLLEAMKRNAAASRAAAATAGPSEGYNSFTAQAAR